MTKNEKKTEILYQLNSGYQLKSMFSSYEQQCLITELIEDGLIFEVSSNYLLTGEARKLLLLYNTIDAYEKSLVPVNELEERLPTQTPNSTAPTTTNEKYQKGIWRFINFNNDWVKFIITGLIVLIFGTWLLVKLKIIR
ncbi:MAG: hypothetical protein JWP94_1519 [Mucilaginibacter sp.]|nr:hypothetical protein [Mucilaginibacter sp.]